MVYARWEVSPEDSGNTEEALAPVSGGRRSLLKEVTSQLRSEGEVRFSQIKKVRQVLQALKKSLCKGPGVEDNGPC